MYSSCSFCKTYMNDTTQHKLFQNPISFIKCKNDCIMILFKPVHSNCFNYPNR